MTDKTIFIFDAQEGDKLADDVHTPDGNILAKKDTILNYDIIANISGHHILEVKVYDTNNELQDLEKVLGKTANKENVKYFDKIRASIRFKHFKRPMMRIFWISKETLTMLLRITVLLI